MQSSDGYLLVVQCTESYGWHGQRGESKCVPEVLISIHVVNSKEQLFSRTAYQDPFISNTNTYTKSSFHKRLIKT